MLNEFLYDSKEGTRGKRIFRNFLYTVITKGEESWSKGRQQQCTQYICQQILMLCHCVIQIVCWALLFKVFTFYVQHNILSTFFLRSFLLCYFYDHLYVIAQHALNFCKWISRRSVPFFTDTAFIRYVLIWSECLNIPMKTNKKLTLYSDQVTLITPFEWSDLNSEIIFFLNIN